MFCRVIAIFIRMSFCIVFVFCFDVVFKLLVSIVGQSLFIVVFPLLVFAVLCFMLVFIVVIFNFLCRLCWSSLLSFFVTLCVVFLGWFCSVNF